MTYAIANTYEVKDNTTEIIVFRKGIGNVKVLIDTEDMGVFNTYRKAYLTLDCEFVSGKVMLTPKTRVLVRDKGTKLVKALSTLVSGRNRNVHVNGNRLDCRKSNLRAVTVFDSVYAELVGTRFGALTIVALTGNKTREHGYIELLCKCDCGEVVTRSAESLIQNKKTITSSCGCKNRGYNSSAFSGYGKVSGSYMRRLYQNAAQRGLECSITVEYLHELLMQQNERCALSGIPIYLQVGTKAFLTSDATASVDRIDSSEGYTVGNVQWVHKDVNAMKLDFDEAYFVKMCSNIATLKGSTYDNVH